MKRVLVAALYTALLAGANAAVADPAIADLREGSMKKLVVHSDPKPSSVAQFETFDGDPMALADYQGKVVVLNFWATWCAPCRKEMPALNALQTEFGGEDFDVVTVATGRQSTTGITKFFDEENINALPKHRDPKQGLARSMAVLGLPVTVVLDRDGNEIARLVGDAEWHSDSARAIVSALIAGQS
ncbi:MAG: TlpA disulfide reductase family protein [Pseudomonadota bacterium]